MTFALFSLILHQILITLKIPNVKTKEHKKKKSVQKHLAYLAIEAATLHSYTKTQRDTWVKYLDDNSDYYNLNHLSDTNARVHINTPSDVVISRIIFQAMVLEPD